MPPFPSNAGHYVGVRYESLNARYRVTCTDPKTNKSVYGGLFRADPLPDGTVTADDPGLLEAAERADDLNVELRGSPGAVPRLNFPERARRLWAARLAAQ